MNREYLYLGIAASISFPLSFIYQLVNYANVQYVSMGGMETAFFWMFIAIPLLLICLVTFQIKIYRLKKIQPNVEKETRSFLIPIIASMILCGLIYAFMARCYVGSHRGTFDTCPLIPGRVNPY